MSAYDDAVAYLDAEVHPRCDYEIYSDMRDIVDEMEVENAKLRELVRDYDKMLELALADYRGFDAPLSDATHIALLTRMYNLGIEVD